MEIRFHELGHESKMRPLKTHSDTSQRRGYEADKKHGEERKQSRPIRKRQEKCQKKATAISPERGGGARMC